MDRGKGFIGVLRRFAFLSLSRWQDCGETYDAIWVFVDAYYGMKKGKVVGHMF